MSSRRSAPRGDPTHRHTFSTAPPQRGVLDDSGGISAVPIEPRLQALFVAFFRLGATAYREPAMMAYLRQECVGKRQWLTKQDFKEGMALCHTNPGAAMM